MISDNGSYEMSGAFTLVSKNRMPLFKAHETSFESRTHEQKEEGRQLDPDACTNSSPQQRAAFTNVNTVCITTLKYLPSTAGSPRKTSIRVECADMHRCRRERERERGKRCVALHTAGG